MSLKSESSKPDYSFLFNSTTLAMCGVAAALYLAYLLNKRKFIPANSKSDNNGDQSQAKIEKAEYSPVSKTEIKSNIDPDLENIVSCENSMSDAHKIALIWQFLNTTENKIFPLTSTQMAKGDRIFGASIHRNEAPFDCIVCNTNRAMTENPIFHGEISTIMNFFALQKTLNTETKVDAKDCIFFATHEPCSLCLSGIAWSGFTQVFYLFSYEQSADSFSMPIDIQMLNEVFGNNGSVEKPFYRKSNCFFRVRNIKQVVEDEIADEEQQLLLQKKIDHILLMYNELAAVHTE